MASSVSFDASALRSVSFQKRAYFQSSSASSSSSSRKASSSSSSSSISSADSSSNGSVLNTFRVAPQSSQLIVSPSSTSSSSTSIAPSHFGQVTIDFPPDITYMINSRVRKPDLPSSSLYLAACCAMRRRVVGGTIPFSRRYRNNC